jgi:hypothetical protein
MLRTFIQVSALLLTLFAGILLVRGSFVLSQSDIAGLSSTHWDYNPSMVKNLSRHQYDTRIGLMLLVISGLFQMANLLWPMRFCDFAVNKMGVIIAIITSAIIFSLAVRMSTVLSKNLQKGVINTLEQSVKKN